MIRNNSLFDTMLFLFQRKQHVYYRYIQKVKSIYVMFNLNVYIYVTNTFDDLQNIFILFIQHFM